MRKVMFRLDSGSKDGQETEDTKMKKYKAYKKQLKKDGEEIISETKTVNRFGNVIILELK